MLKRLSLVFLIFLASGGFARGQDVNSIKKCTIGDATICLSIDTNGKWVSGWSVFGENKISASGGSAILVDGAVALDNIDNNYWGGATICPSNDNDGLWVSGSLVHYSQNITYDAGASCISSSSFSGIVCSDGLIARKRNNEPLSLASSDTSNEDCKNKLENGGSYSTGGQAKKAIDTLRDYIEQCYWQPGAGSAFTPLDGAYGYWLDGGEARWPDFQSWLKKVLYLNPDSGYYCADVSDILLTVAHADAHGDHYDINAQIAILRYVVGSGRCPAMANMLQNQRPFQLQWYRDTCHDTVRYPLDTTVPSLEQLGLEILRGPQVGYVSHSGTIASTGLLNVHVTNNPFDKEIAVSFDMGRTAMVTMELRDVLGKSVPIANAKYLLEQPGTHEVRIPVPNLPPGTYYLRLTTDTGDAKTIKVVKE